MKMTLTSDTMPMALNILQGEMKTFPSLFDERRANISSPNAVIASPGCFNSVDESSELIGRGVLDLDGAGGACDAARTARPATRPTNALPISFFCRESVYRVPSLFGRVSVTPEGRIRNERVQVLVSINMIPATSDIAS